LIAISPSTHYDLYHDWRKALEFCRGLPDVAPPEPVTFHMYWRQRRAGFWRKVRPFGRKQALPVPIGRPYSMVLTFIALILVAIVGWRVFGEEQPIVQPAIDAAKKNPKRAARR